MKLSATVETVPTLEKLADKTNTREARIAFLTVKNDLEVLKMKFSSV
jgi:hypothetical protein